MRRIPASCRDWDAGLHRDVEQHWSHLPASELRDAAHQNAAHQDAGHQDAASLGSKRRGCFQAGDHEDDALPFHRRELELRDAAHQDAGHQDAGLRMRA